MSVVKFRLTRVCSETECLNCRRGVSPKDPATHLCRTCVARGIPNALREIENDIASIAAERDAFVRLLSKDDAIRYQKFKEYLDQTLRNASYSEHRESWRLFYRRLVASLDTDTPFTNLLACAYNQTIRLHDLRILRIIQVAYIGTDNKQRNLFE